MLSLLSVAGIFTEIFASGVLITGTISFLVRYFRLKQLKDLFLSLALLCFSLYTILTIVSQFFFNLGSQLSDLITIHKTISISLLIGSFFVAAFIIEHFAHKRKLLLLLVPLALIDILFFFRVLASDVNLIYRKDIIEPIVSYSLPAPIKSLWVLMWLILAFAFLVRAARSRERSRSLSLYGAGSAFLFVVAYLCIVLYTASGQGAFMLASWIITLGGVIGLTLSEVIPADSPLANNPLNFFRTRILFKLIFIFVLLIVVLFEGTTLATLSLSKSALSKSILNTYYEIARGIAQKDWSSLKEIVVTEKVGRSGMVYLVDKSGRIIAHPDPVRMGEDLSMLEPVKEVVNNRSGRIEFKDELGYPMVGAYFPVSGGGIIVQEPLEDAYFELRQLESNSILFMIIGIIITVLAGIFFAESIEMPIHKLTRGTEAVSNGDLNYRIKSESIDEIGSLALAFNKMTQNLRESQERLVLSEKLASLGTMAAGMAHEIKNPLVSLRTFSQLLQVKWEDPEYREKFASIVPMEIERINKIAESLLKFGRPAKAEISKINVNNLLEEILILNESECKKHNVRITTKFAELPLITADASQLSQALLNIILNAIQSMDKGGELIVKTDVGEVVKLGRMGKGKQTESGEIVWGEEDEARKPVPVVFIEVTDTGAGIEPENLKVLFDPFFTTKDRGTGMGLPITLRIIEENKGSIKVRSQRGKGTTFLITLPQRMEDL
ncbi:MAG: ATP-binding protein [Candidatus Margulisiibacteriota bacterium]|nr:HAMP domain-containing protein [Candidatus Margulisiibacteriota bacterium]